MSFLFFVQFLYRLDPKSFKSTKPPCPIKDISHISLSPKKDTVVVVHFKQAANLPALVLDLGLDQNRACEFTIEVLQAAIKLGPKFDVKFSDNIPFEVIFFLIIIIISLFFLLYFLFSNVNF